jgi:hypothetical protein
LGARRTPDPYRPAVTFLLGTSLLAAAPGHAEDKRQKFTPEDEAWFLAEIDRCRAVLEREGERVSDASALRLSIQSYWFRRYRRHY